jgi:hypothetical protein
MVQSNFAFDAFNFDLIRLFVLSVPVQRVVSNPQESLRTVSGALEAAGTTTAILEKVKLCPKSRHISAYLDIPT